MTHSNLLIRTLLAPFLLHGLSYAGARQDDTALEGPQDRFALLESAVIETLPTVLEGRVLTPQGLPAEGAVVVSSAGGKAVSDAQGFFSLEVEVSRDAREVQITAVQAGGTTGLLASAAVPLFHSGGTIPAGTLRLQSGVTCEPSWLPTFGGAPGVGGAPQGEAGVVALTVYDDGTGGGPALYAGGDFTTACGVSANRIARWDGTSWSALGVGIGGGQFPYISALTVYDDGAGGGPALYVGGDFTSAGGLSANRIARWDGTSWSALDSGTDDVVFAMTVYDDGMGGAPALFVGGAFTIAGGVSANHIARWDGTAWSALGEGVNGQVEALTVHDDGTVGGRALFAGGDFTTAGVLSASRIAKWDGTSWFALDSGMNAPVRALTAYNDGMGGGPALYAGGDFSTAGGVSASRIAKWDGTSWSALGSGMEGFPTTYVFALTVYDDGTGGGPALYAGGGFTTAGGVSARSIAKWDGTSWSALGSGLGWSPPLVPPYVVALSEYDDGTGGGPALYAGGMFTRAGGVGANSIAKWDGTSWSAFDTGMNFRVQALAVYDDETGGGPALYAGGSFTTAGGVNVRSIAKWDGSSWSALGGGMNDFVMALTVFDDGAGGGPALYAGGFFTSAGGVSASRIAKWDGASWSALGTGMDASVRALSVYDDGMGGGPALYAGGFFTSAGGVSANRIAKWDGSSWSALDSGMDDMVFALTVYDDGVGGGPALYAGGRFFTAGGVLVFRIAKWDGTSWSALGSGMDDSVYSLTVYDDGTGSGANLYAGGQFSGAGSVIASSIAKWNGMSWSALGTGMEGFPTPFVNALTVYDDGTGGGPALYAGGFFTSAGGVSVRRIAMWDGTSWSAVGRGIAGGQFPSVTALTVYGHGALGGPALYVGGNFGVSPAGDSYIAKWGGCAGPEVAVAFCFGDGGGTACPCGNSAGPEQGCANSGGIGAVLAGEGSSSVAADDLALTAMAAIPSQPGLFFQGDTSINGGNGARFGDGLRCAGGSVVRLEIVTADGTGSASSTVPIASIGGASPGVTKYYQWWYRDPAGSPCGTGFNLSNGLEVTWAP